MNEEVIQQQSENQINKQKEKFIFGVSTAAHQVEGGNTNDWSAWELKNANRLAKESAHKFEKVVPDWEAIEPEATDPKNYISGNAADHYNKFIEDIEIMKSLGVDAYRFSIEWSRIEPTEGKWDEREIQHYFEVLDKLKEVGITPWVTLWHRTNPLWIRDIGDWSNSKTVDYYLRFVEKMVQTYRGRVKHWMTLNEPIMSLGGGYLTGEYPPNKKNPITAYKVLKNFAIAHNKAYKLIHTYQEDAFVGIPHAGFYLEAFEDKLVNRLTVKLGHYLANWLFLDKLVGNLDFIGVQYYTRGIVDWFKQVPGPGEKTDMGWEVYPIGLRKFMEIAWRRYHIPMIVTENGVTDSKDRIRAKAIEDHVSQIMKAREEGIDVRGYFYWSLLDNLEWDKGFWPKFGLVEVDRINMHRTVRPSAQKYKEIIKKIP